MENPLKVIGIVVAVGIVVTVVSTWDKYNDDDAGWFI